MLLRNCHVYKAVSQRFFVSAFGALIHDEGFGCSLILKIVASERNEASDRKEMITSTS